MHFLHILLAIVVTISAITLAVFIHELGHLAACRGFRIPVDEFSVGFGPTLAHRYRAETKFSLKFFPFGGFIELNNEAYETSPLWQRIFVSLAGPAANLLPIVILGGIVIGFGPILSAMLGLYIATLQGLFATIFSPLDLFHWLPASHIKEFSGPIGFGHTASNLLIKDHIPVVWFTIFLVMNLGIGLFNLVPFPLLDGGQIVFYISEMIIGRKQSERVRAILGPLATILLIILTIRVTAQDIGNFF